MFPARHIFSQRPELPDESCIERLSTLLSRATVVPLELDLTLRPRPVSARLFGMLLEDPTVFSRCTSLFISTPSPRIGTSYMDLVLPPVSFQILPLLTFLSILFDVRPGIGDPFEPLCRAIAECTNLPKFRTLHLEICPESYFPFLTPLIDNAVEIRLPYYGFLSSKPRTYSNLVALKLSVTRTHHITQLRLPALKFLVIEGKKALKWLSNVTCSLSNLELNEPYDESFEEPPQILQFPSLITLHWAFHKIFNLSVLFKFFSAPNLVNLHLINGPDRINPYSPSERLTEQTITEILDFNPLPRIASISFAWNVVPDTLFSFLQRWWPDVRSLTLHIHPGQQRELQALVQALAAGSSSSPQVCPKLTTLVFNFRWQYTLNEFMEDANVILSARKGSLRRIKCHWGNEIRKEFLANQPVDMLT